MSEIYKTSKPGAHILQYNLRAHDITLTLSRTRVRPLLERLNLLLVTRPRRARYPKERPRGRVRDVADARRVLRLRDVDRVGERVRGHRVPRDERVVADVQSLHAPEDQRRRVLARLGNDDVDGLEELGEIGRAHV